MNFASECDSPYAEELILSRARSLRTDALVQNASMERARGKANERVGLRLRRHENITRRPSAN